MAGKNNVGRVGNLEKEMEEVKVKLGRLTEIEKMMECLNQGFAQVFLALEETNRSVHSIRNSSSKDKAPTEKDNLNTVLKEKTLVEDGKVQEQKKISVEGRDGLQGKASDEPVIIFQSTHNFGLNDPRSKKLKDRREPDEDEIIRRMLMLDEPFIELPSYSDFGAKGKLMKLKGRMKHKEVVVLIKSDTTHNFISTKLVDELQLPLTSTRDYIVIMSDFGAEGDSTCMWVILEMPGVTIVEDFLPLDLVDNVDIILGNKWLNTLEDAMLYYEDGLCRMKFLEGNNAIDWKTDLNL